MSRVERTLEVIEKLTALEARYEELNDLMSRPEAAADREKLTAYAREQAGLEETVHTFRQLKAAEAQLAEAEAMLEEPDEELRQLARDEVEALQSRIEELLRQLMELLLPRDPNDGKNVIVEIRAGTGGNEAALFAADLYRMYARFAERRRWKLDVLSTSESELSGFKEIIFEVRGQGVYSRLKYESGVHRVQRIPVTESGGRIHTSTATVAVLPEAEEVDVHIAESDLRVDVYRSTGHGGQSVNTTDSAVRITHLPTGLVVTCQDEKSQLKNKTKALAVLRSRLLDMEQRKRAAEVGDARRSMVGSAERAEKIRTYNFPQDRVTDHRINLTLHNLPAILQGDLDPLLDALASADRGELVRA